MPCRWTSVLARGSRLAASWPISVLLSPWTAWRLPSQKRRSRSPSLVASFVPPAFELDAEGRGTGLPADVQAPRIAVFRLPYGGLVVCLELWVRAMETEMVQLLRHTLGSWTSMRVQGCRLDETLRVGRVVDPLLQDLALADVHHLVVVDPGQFTLVEPVTGGAAEPAADDRRPPTGTREELVARLVTRNVDNVRTNQSNTRYPVATNRAADSLTAVGPFVTVTMRPPGELEGWLLWSSVILIASLARLHPSGCLRRPRQDGVGGASRAVQAPRALHRPPTARRPLRPVGEARARAGLRCGAQLDVLFVLPSPMLASHHNCAASLLSLPEGVRVTSDLLARASLAVVARRDVVRAAERAEDEVRVQRVTVAAGLLSVVAVLSGIFFGFFGASAAPVADKQPSFFDPRYLVFYLVLLAVAVSVAFMFLLLRRRYRVRSETLELSSYGIRRFKRSRGSRDESVPRPEGRSTPRSSS